MDIFPREANPQTWSHHWSRISQWNTSYLCPSTLPACLATRTAICDARSSLAFGGLWCRGHVDPHRPTSAISPVNLETRRLTRNLRKEFNSGLVQYDTRLPNTLPNEIVVDCELLRSSYMVSATNKADHDFLPEDAKKFDDLANSPTEPGPLSPCRTPNPSNRVEEPRCCH